MAKTVQRKRPGNVNGALFTFLDAPAPTAVWQSFLTRKVTSRFKQGVQEDLTPENVLKNNLWCIENWKMIYGGERTIFQVTSACCMSPSVLRGCAHATVRAPRHDKYLNKLGIAIIIEITLAQWSWDCRGRRFCKKKKELTYTAISISVLATNGLATRGTLAPGTRK